MKKFHKIKNVNVEDCTCEQKIAYNFAFADVSLMTSLGMTADEFAKHTEDAIYDRHPEIYGKYNVDTIIECLRNGIEDFSKRECCVCWEYKDIGLAFPMEKKAMAA